MRKSKATIEMSGALWLNQSGRTFWAVSGSYGCGFELPLVLWADSSMKPAAERERLTLSKRIENARISFAKGVLALWLPSRELRQAASSPPLSTDYPHYQSEVKRMNLIIKGKESGEAAPPPPHVAAP